MTTDPIADLLTRIRNATSARHSKVIVPHSKMKISVLQVLKEHHFIHDFKVEKSGTKTDIVIELSGGRKTLDLKRVSKPGQRLYLKKDEIKPVLSGYGLTVLSTSKGIMTGEEARKKGIGGEILCEVW